MIKLKNIEVTYSELLKAYLDCRKRKRRTENALQFEINNAEKLYNLYLELNTDKYRIGKSIAFCVDKPVKREVFAADFKDRIIHHLVVNRINKYFEEEIIFDTYSCRKGKGTSMAVNRCCEQIKEASNNYTIPAYIVKCDLKSFFMTINKDILYKEISDFLKAKTQKTGEDVKFTLKLIKQIIYNRPQDNCILKQSKSHWIGLPKEKSLFGCKENLGLPIGNLTSQIFANFYLSKFDHFMKEVLCLKYYGRYVDDFFFIVYDKCKIKCILDKCRERLSMVGVTLHPKKVYIQEVKKGVKFVGAIIKPNRIYIGNRTKGNFWNILKISHEYIKSNKPSVDDIKHFICSVNSYLGFMIHYNSFNIRRKMLVSDFMYPWYRHCHTTNRYSKLIVA